MSTNGTSSPAAERAPWHFRVRGRRSAGLGRSWRYSSSSEGRARSLHLTLSRDHSTCSHSAPSAWVDGLSAEELVHRLGWTSSEPPSSASEPR